MPRLAGARISVTGEDAMVSLGEALGRLLGAPFVLYIDGELGAGKTTLARGILRAQGHSGAVKSPTYTLVEPYQLAHCELYHFDLYRLGDPEELEFMGIRDYFSGDAILLVEWPQRGLGILPAADLAIGISTELPGRSLSFEAWSQRGVECLQQLPIESGLEWPRLE